MRFLCPDSDYLAADRRDVQFRDVACPPCKIRWTAWGRALGTVASSESRPGADLRVFRVEGPAKTEPGQSALTCPQSGQPESASRYPGNRTSPTVANTRAPRLRRQLATAWLASKAQAPPKRTKSVYGESVVKGFGGAFSGSLARRSYSEITWAPSNSRVAASSRLNRTAMAVVSDP